MIKDNSMGSNTGSRSHAANIDASAIAVSTTLILNHVKLNK